MSAKSEPNWEFRCQQYVDFDNINGEAADETDLYFGGAPAVKKEVSANTDAGFVISVKNDTDFTAAQRTLRRSPRLRADGRSPKSENRENVPADSSSADKRLRPRAPTGAVVPPSNALVFGQKPAYSWSDVIYTPPKPPKKKRLTAERLNVPKRRSPLAILQSHGSALRQKTAAHRFGNAIAAAVRGPVKALQSLGGGGRAKTDETSEETDLSEKVDFVSMLRRYTSPKKGEKPASRQNTVPSPFSFVDKTSGRPAAAAGSSFHSMAEQVAAFQTKTPLRFRTVQRGSVGQADVRRDPNPVARPLSFQPPQTPRLMTRGRQRAVNVPSQLELEERELEEMRKSQFHAKPFNPEIFKESSMGVPELVRKPATVAEPFKLSAGVAPTRTVTEEPAPLRFQARPVPRAVLEPPKDLKSLRQVLVTDPKSPAFALRNRVHRSMTMAPATAGQPANEVFKRCSSVRGTSSFAGAVAASSDHSRPLTVTRVQPFTFDEKVRGLQERRQQRLQEVLEREKREREFHARPLPNFASVTLPPKEPRPATEPAPFDLQVQTRAAAKEEKIKKMLDEEAANLRAMATFKAKPCKVIYEEPFCPERSERPLTAVPVVQLSTELRSRERERYDAEVRARAAQMAAVVREREELRQQEEDAEEVAMRAAAVHRAQPVRHYRPVEVKPCGRSPVNPVSPDLATKKRKRNA